MPMSSTRSTVSEPDSRPLHSVLLMTVLMARQGLSTSEGLSTSGAAIRPLSRMGSDVVHHRPPPGKQAPTLFACVRSLAGVSPPMRDHHIASGEPKSALVAGESLELFRRLSWGDAADPRPPEPHQKKTEEKKNNNKRCAVQLLLLLFHVQHSFMDGYLHLQP